MSIIDPIDAVGLSIRRAFFEARHVGDNATATALHEGAAVLGLGHYLPTWGELSEQGS